MQQSPSGRVFSAFVAALLLVSGPELARAEGSWVQVDEFGSTGSALEQFLFPYDVVVVDELLYVADSNNNRVQVFDLRGTFQSWFGGTGELDGQFRRDRGIGASFYGGSGAKILVSDAKNDRVQMFTPQGGHLESWGSIGDGREQFFRPRGLAGAPDGSIVIGDADNDRVKVYNEDLTIRAIFGRRGGTDGRFWSPVDLEVSADGTIYVVDTFNSRVQYFTLDGQFLGKFGGYGGGDGQLVHPKAIAIDADGNLFVADTTDGVIDVERIQKFTPSGEWLTSFGSPGPGVGQLRFATGLDFDRSGRLYVADAHNDRVTIWEAGPVSSPRRSLSSLKGRFGG